MFTNVVVNVNKMEDSAISEIFNLFMTLSSLLRFKLKVCVENFNDIVSGVRN
jgi:hypothetical protein